MMAASPTGPWTLGAVVDDHAVDSGTHLFIARADAPLPAARDLERRLLALRLGGTTTLIVHLVHGAPPSDAMIASLVRAGRKLEVSNARLLVSADEPELRHALEYAGFDLVDLDGGGAGPPPSPDARVGARFRRPDQVLRQGSLPLPQGQAGDG